MRKKFSPRSGQLLFPCLRICIRWLRFPLVISLMVHKVFTVRKLQGVMCASTQPTSQTRMHQPETPFGGWISNCKHWQISRSEIRIQQERKSDRAEALPCVDSNSQLLSGTHTLHVCAVRVSFVSCFHAVSIEEKSLLIPSISLPLHHTPGAISKRAFTAGLTV